MLKSPSFATQEYLCNPSGARANMKSGRRTKKEEAQSTEHNDSSSNIPTFTHGEGEKDNVWSGNLHRNWL